MAGESILVVEDDEDILELIAYNLQREGYSVRKAESGEKALEAVVESVPDLVLLDLMLPGMSGLDVCRRLKNGQRAAGVPVIVVTARGDEADVVSGLELGADDYVTKPFRPRELVARVHAVLRRRLKPEPEPAERIAVHDIEIDPRRREVLAKGKPVALTRTEFDILYFLARHPGWVFTRYQIVDAVHGEDYPVTDRSVDVQMVGLRHKLGKAGRHVETVRGVGYRFRDRES